MSKRKIMNSRFTRIATSGESGPVHACGLVDAAELRADEADPDDRGDRPADEREDHPELAPVEVALLHQDDPEDKRHDERRRIDPCPDPGAHPAERAERLSLAPPLEHDSEHRERHVATDPDHGGEDVDREVGVVRGGREREEEDRPGEEEAPARIVSTPNPPNGRAAGAAAPLSWSMARE